MSDSIPLPQLLSNSLTLNERLATQQQFDSCNNANGLYSRWIGQEQYADHFDFLIKRLSCENIQLEEFQHILGESESQIHDRANSQEWITRLAQQLNQTDINIELPKITDERVMSGDFLILFAPLIMPTYQDFQQQVQQLSDSHSAPLVDVEAVCSQYYQELVTKVATASGRTMVLELQVAKMTQQLVGETSRDRFTSFVSLLKGHEFRDQIVREYVVLTRIVSVVIARWKRFGLEFLKHLSNDVNELQGLFFNEQPVGKLTTIKAGAGDTHRAGRSVVVMGFENGQKIVYKPRSMAIEKTFGELLGWCNSHVDGLDLKRLSVLDKGEYGWAEFVEFKACRDDKQLHQFFYRQGALLAIMYLLDGNDFHYENIIASGEHPVAVDLETLFHPYLDHFYDDAAQPPPNFPIKQSVLRTGMLPKRLWTEGNDSGGIDLSGMGDMEDQLTPYEMLTIKHPGTDEMNYVRERVVMPTSNNRPTLDGQTVNVTDYSQDILNGFSACYKLFLRQRKQLLADDGPIQAFANNEIRVIFRETRIYSTFLIESLHPDFMRNALERDLFFEKLWIATENQPYLEALIKYEREELEYMDVPMFMTRPASAHLWTTHGECLKGFFRQPALVRTNRLINNLCEDDLHRQLWVIKSSLLSVELAKLPSIKPKYELDETALPATQSELVEHSIRIGEQIRKLAFDGKAGANWFIWKPLANRYWDIEFMSPAFYDGLAGTALYLGYLGHITGLSEYRELAEKSLATARYLWQKYPEQIDDIGMFSGWAGFIYVLTHLGKLWQQESLLQEAESLTEQIEQRLEQDTFYDVIGGSAGTIVVLLRLYRITSSPKLVELAVKCGEHMLANKVENENGTGWVLSIAGEQPLAGMSHGGAGSAWALSELAEVSGEQKFRDIAVQALNYEQNVFSCKENNWPDLREGDRPEGSDVKEDGQCFLTAWCHGAPGIGLARLAMKDYLQDERIQKDIETALEKTRSYGYKDNHSLCHGVLGNLDLLLTAGTTLNRPDLLEEVMRIAGQVLAGVPQNGWKTGLMYNLETPGFMVGLSGIGFQLLRIAYPDIVPSVLSLEGPKVD